MIRHTSERPCNVVAALRRAAPYIRMYKGKIFVIKAGGGAFRLGRDHARAAWSRSPSCITSASAWCSCTAAARSSTRCSKRSGVATRMVQGRRVTDAQTLDATTMVLNGLINTRLLALCREFGVPAVGVSGVDGGLIRAHKRPPVNSSPAARSWTTAWSATSTVIDAGASREAARRRSPAGREPAVVGRSRAAAQHQRRHGGRGHRRRAQGREADPRAPARRASSSDSTTRAR